MNKACPNCGSTDYDEWYMTTCHTILSCKEWDELNKKIEGLEKKLVGALCRCGPSTEISPSLHTASCEYVKAVSPKPEEPAIKAPECDHQWGEPSLNDAKNSALHWCSKCPGYLIGAPCKCCGRADHGGNIVRINR